MNLPTIKEKGLQLLKVIFPIILLILAISEIRKFVLGLNIHMLQQEISQIDLAKLIIFLLLTICAIFPMFFYDLVIAKILKMNIPIKKLIKQSLIANTFSNLLGLGGLIGVMLRAYFYQTKAISKRKLLRTITLVSLFFLSGVSLLAWFVLLVYRDIPLLVNTKWLYLAVIGVGLYLPLLFLGTLKNNKKKTSPFVTLKSRFFLLFASVLEWTAAFFSIWLLSSILDISISVWTFFAIFIVAACAGIVSMIPGGLGSFDLVFIWGTQYVGILDEKVVVLLILYRIGYFFIPFIIGAILLLKEYWNNLNQSWKNLPNTFVQYISHWLLTILVFVSGLILLFSAALPGIIERIRLAENIITLPIISLSHQLSVATGILLLGLSRGIEYKVKRAYYLTIGVLSLAALLSLSKGFNYEESIFLLFVALLLRLSKARFYRESYVFTWGKMSFDFFIIIFITTMYILIGYLNLPTAKIQMPTRFTPYLISDYGDLFYSAIIGLIIASIIYVIGYYKGKPKKWILESSTNQEEKIKEHIAKYGGNVLTHLVFLHDKYIFWNHKKNVLFQFQKYADKVVILGDLVGEKSEFPHAIEEFLTLSDFYGYTPVFYEISENMLTTLHENGYDFFKLGEEAYVDLKDFSLSRKELKTERAAKNKFERDQFTVEVIPPPFNNDLLKELQIISNSWLAGRKEKGFSLGFFDKHYLNKFGIAIMRGPDKKIIGFASLMPVYDNHETLSIDLMRFKPGSPSGKIDFIYLSLFEWAKEKGYQRFNLGMAPLSNVGLSKFSFFSEKIAAQIYLHGQFFYHFQGLRKFKEKFNVTWIPKYLAYRKKSFLPITMTQVTLLIGKRKDGSG